VKRKNKIQKVVDDDEEDEESAELVVKRKPKPKGRKQEIEEEDEESPEPVVVKRKNKIRKNIDDEEEDGEEEEEVDEEDDIQTTSRLSRVEENSAEGETLGEPKRVEPNFLMACNNSSCLNSTLMALLKVPTKWTVKNVWSVNPDTLFPDKKQVSINVRSIQEELFTLIRPFNTTPDGVGLANTDIDEVPIKHTSDVLIRLLADCQRKLGAPSELVSKFKRGEFDVVNVFEVIVNVLKINTPFMVTMNDANEDPEKLVERAKAQIDSGLAILLPNGAFGFVLAQLGELPLTALVLDAPWSCLVRNDDVWWLYSDTSDNVRDVPNIERFIAQNRGRIRAAVYASSVSGKWCK